MIEPRLIYQVMLSRQATIVNSKSFRFTHGKNTKMDLEIKQRVMQLEVLL